MAGLSTQLLHRGSDQGADGTIRLFEGNLKSSASWAEELPTDSVCFCFNQSGESLIMAEGSTRLYLRPQSLSLFTVGSSVPVATRIGPAHHRFVLLTVPRDLLLRFFGNETSHLHPEFRRFLAGEEQSSFGVVRPMWSDEKRLLDWFCAPPVPLAARALWYRSKLGELLAVHLFSHRQEPFCVKRNNRANQFTDRALAHLEEHYEDALDLEALSSTCGCSPPYLSRCVKRDTGKTLQQHLRAIRIDAAARLLNRGANVTEAAFGVGYSSLSHFSKAFEAEKGLLPSEFLKAG